MARKDRNIDRLWAPWRIKYITAAPKQKGCLFCINSKSKNSVRGAENHVIFRSEHSFCILNKFPYNNGHLMVSPVRHIKELSQLNEKEMLDLFKSLNTAKSLLDAVLKPDGYNIGINMSNVAGAGIPGHLHIHIVPRWRGDTNFMPVIYNTRVISQSLNELNKKLKLAYVQSIKNKRDRR